MSGDCNRQAIDAAGLEILPKRWIVERTFAWISRNRRLAREFERYTTTVVAFVRHDPHHAQATCYKPLVMNSNFPDGLSVGADQTVLTVRPKYNTRNFSIPFAQYQVDIAS